MYQLGSNNKSTNLTLLATVKDNKKQFTPRQVKAAEQAQELQRRLGYLSQRQLEDVLRRKLVHNCNLTADDAKRALYIFGPLPAIVKGKTPRQRK